MKLNEYVFILGSYVCDKRCPYCVAKMNQKKTDTFENELEELKNKINQYKEQGITFNNFILSGNGETSLYSLDELKSIKELVESSKIFDDYRIQTSGNLFNNSDLLKLFSNWIKEITVISDDANIDKQFYQYETPYLNSKRFLSSKRVRVNIVLIKDNIRSLNNMINYYSELRCVEKIAIKILDNYNNSTNESKWISDNAITIKQISEVIDLIKQENDFVGFANKKFIFGTKNKKTLTLRYSEKNEYDGININNTFSWHNRKIKKGTYGELSKVEEELDEAREALEQGNKLMFLIELSDVIGAVEGIIEQHGLSLNDLIKFSNKVKESKKSE